MATIMAENSEEREVICPDIKNLISVETNISCPLNGCSKILPSTSALRMHLVKRHKIREDGYEVFERKKSSQKVWKKKSVYCCPVAACIRGRNSGKYFNRLAHVKQHYMIVHGEKKFSCKKCDKKFGRNDVCVRHEKTCGMIFTCSCGLQFNCRTSLLTHARRNDHDVPKLYKKNVVEVQQSLFNVRMGSSSLLMRTIPAVNDKALKSKLTLVDAETQTMQTCCSYDTLQQKNGSISTTDIQPKDVERKAIGPFDLEDMAICKQTQTKDDFSHGFDFDVDFPLDDYKEVTHSQTQTNLNLALESFPLFEDNETQTLESYLELYTSTNECGTQTKTFLDEIFSVDNETQTRLPSLNLDENFPHINNNNSTDGQTQTFLPWSDFINSSKDVISIATEYNLMEDIAQTQNS
ncbi:uncharacterized protein LOC124436488 isoform X2 [Xenia sp. Carnegie-2017]|uniref:uncharacterized protein LOC124436488 isoform X2 n=1 Tax=Xenia sp. Carnegie-2017 TaxID=2897299 RepID=UPI001F0453A2|nr:uncharacterized protein LOC124436488 isoform X2 [Xenia sp. Carnegie-2017]